jgi:hypothetical protein
MAARPAIDGGMAAAIRDQAVWRRTLTVYTDLRRVTVPLGIDDRSTIWLCLVDRVGRVAGRGSGGPGPGHRRRSRHGAATAPELAAAAAQAAGRRPSSSRWRSAPFGLPLAVLGVSPATAHPTVADRLVACLGAWACRAAPVNVRAVRLTGPYRWHCAIGPRLSLADHGLTFATSTARGVCLLLREPVRSIGPLGLIHARAGDRRSRSRRACRANWAVRRSAAPPGPPWRSFPGRPSAG